MNLQFFSSLIVILFLTTISSCLTTQSSLKTTNNYFLPILSEVWIPISECLTLPPINTFYLSTLYTYDSTKVNICNFTKSIDCNEFMCFNNQRFNFENETVRNFVVDTFNYCLYCKNSNTEIFRENYENGTCNNLKHFSYYQFNYITLKHCNNDLNKIRHIPLTDEVFFNSIYFTRKISNFNEENRSNFKNNNMTIEEVFHVYSSSFTNFTIDDEGPFDIPFECLCNYFTVNNTNDDYVSYQCSDFYSSYQIPFSYRYFIIIVMIFFTILFFVTLFVVSIPRCYERFKTFKQLPELKIASNRLPYKIYLFFNHFTNIVMHPTAHLLCCCVCEFLENFLRFLFNFEFALGFYKVYFAGIFRAIAVLFLVCGYSSLVITWSHVVDLSNRRMKGDTTSKLSKYNLSILVIFYILVVIVIIIAIAVFIALKEYSYALIVVCLAVLFYLLTFVLGFAFYGIKIFISLRTTQKKSGLGEYRFTKFILAETFIFFLTWLLTVFVAFTYILGNDVLGVFFSLTRNQFVDIALFIICVLSVYILYSKNLFIELYGEKTYQIAFGWIDKIYLPVKRKVREKINSLKKEKENETKNKEEMLENVSSINNIKVDISRVDSSPTVSTVDSKTNLNTLEEDKSDKSQTMIKL
ncbi:hypothetical protein ABK040_016196 [Willaertia magna]